MTITLEKIEIPPVLVSPATLLRRRQGNSFEMATLLCSMLIGAGYPAMVVSGSAKLETVNNDQRNVKYPLPDDSMDNELKVDSEKLEISDTYRLKPLPDLESHLTEKLEKIKFERDAREKAEQEEVARVARETLEDEVLFNDPYRLSHAWVMIVQNAPWSTKPRIKIVNEEGDEVVAPPSVTFIEPSTGFEHNTSSKAYIHIESVWNNLNYYVNLQNCRIREMNWDLRNTNEWEHFLVGEPIEMQIPEEVSDENLGGEANKFKLEKHLDMSRSWVEKLHIGEREMDERFPNLHKAVLYQRVLHERFSPHSQVDGKVEQLTFYSDDNYNEPEIRWNWYENRSDLMARVKFGFASGQTEEFFHKGRPDALKYLLCNVDQSKSKILHFFSAPRPDSLQYAEVHKERIILEFEKSPGSCYHKEFISKQEMTKLREITEKFQRDSSKPALDDIATRNFLLEENKIVLKFHYLNGALTAATREFIKPPKPDYGHEIIFNPLLTKGFRFGVSDPEPTQRELYTMLLQQLKDEDTAKKEFYKRVEELNRIFELRQTERKYTMLKFRAFDSLRNTAARKNRLEQEEQEKKLKKERHENQPDFLAPYLVPYMGRTLTQKESCDAYSACLSDLKSRFVSLLNELQRRYEDLTAEAQSLKKFLNKFENKFDDFDYERMLQESKDLELNKRMVQKRLTITHEEAQKKYDMVKQSLLKDKRLCLRNVPTECD